MTQISQKIVIGGVEEVSFPELGIDTLHARIDTGAQTSAIWAASVVLENGRLKVVFLGPEHPLYTGEAVYFNDFVETVVASSNGHTETRFKVRTVVRLAGKRIRARLTLADRSTQKYPVLIGRNVLRGKFLVDVKHDSVLNSAEEQPSPQMKSIITKRDD